MKNLVFHFLLAAIFLFYQIISFCWGSLPFDPFFPFFLGALFWRLGLKALFLGVVFWGLVLDSFSSLVPGPSVLAYLFSLILFWQLKKRLALHGFLPGLMALVFAIFCCVWLRLYGLPRFFDLPLPTVSFYTVNKVFLGTLIWGLFCWFLCQISFMRNLLEIPTTSEP